jgi:hypothetical protein
MIDVLVIGGGNAALCAALTAPETYGQNARGEWPADQLFHPRHAL